VSGGGLRIDRAACIAPQIIADPARRRAAVERDAGGSVLFRPDEDRLRAWLADYSLGELWEKNLLGGRPAPEPASAGGR
jgi:hypothetical protein